AVAIEIQAHGRPHERVELLLVREVRRGAREVLSDGPDDLAVLVHDQVDAVGPARASDVRAIRIELDDGARIHRAPEVSAKMACSVGQTAAANPFENATFTSGWRFSSNTRSVFRSMTPRRLLLFDVAITRNDPIASTSASPDSPRSGRFGFAGSTTVSR